MTAKNFLAASFVALSLITIDAYGEMLMPVPGQSPVAPAQMQPFAARQPIGMVPVSQTTTRIRVSQQTVNPVGVGVGGVPGQPLPGQPIPPGMGPGPGTHGAAPCPPPMGGGVRVAVGVGCGRGACGPVGCGRGRRCGGVRVRAAMRVCGPGPCGGGVRVSVRVRGCFGRGRRC